MTREISSLPSEVLIHIFQFLNVHHRLVACRVCKMWLNTINCRQLLCDIKVIIGSNIDERIKTFYHMTRRFQCFSFFFVIIENSVLNFLKKYSHQFVTLFFIKCRVPHEINEGPPCTLLQCDYVKHLHIECSNVIVLFASLANVTILEFKFFSYITDYIVFQLNKSMNKLETLSLFIRGFCNDKSIKEYYLDGETIDTSPSHSVLTFAGVQMLLERNRNTLTDIDLLALQLSPSNVKTISEIRGLKLRLLKCNFNVDEKFAKKFCENQFSLISLDLSSIWEVSNETVCTICTYLPNLQELVIKKNNLIDNCLIKILQLEQLEKLDLSCSVGISKLSYHEAILNLKAFKLRHLYLKESKISDESLFKLLKHNENIRKLDISHTNVSNKTLNMISQNLIFLEHLILDSCTEISDEGLTGECESHSDTFTPTPLSNLKKLRFLSLMNNSLTSSGILKAIRFPNLTDLLLTQSDGLILDNDFVIQMKEQNPLLFRDNCSLTFNF